MSEWSHVEHWLLEEFVMWRYPNLIDAWVSAVNSPWYLKDWLVVEHPVVLNEFLEVEGAQTPGPQSTLAQAQSRKQAP